MKFARTEQFYILKCTISGYYQHLWRAHIIRSKDKDGRNAILKAKEMTIIKEGQKSKPKYEGKLELQNRNYDIITQISPENDIAARFSPEHDIIQQTSSEHDIATQRASNVYILKINN